jgi:hypothetical protein
MSGWRCDTGGDLPPTVYPLDDLRDHIVDGRPCWCNPFDDDGVVVHNAADEREKYERGERQKN